MLTETIGAVSTLSRCTWRRRPVRRMGRGVNPLPTAVHIRTVFLELGLVELGFSWLRGSGRRRRRTRHGFLRAQWVDYQQRCQDEQSVVQPHVFLLDHELRKHRSRDCQFTLRSYCGKAGMPWQRSGPDGGQLRPGVATEFDEFAIAALKHQ